MVYSIYNVHSCTLHNVRHTRYRAHFTTTYTGKRIVASGKCGTARSQV